MPPFDAGVVHCRTAEDAAAVADVAVGLSGIVAKVTGFEGVDAVESPRPFLVLTVNIYSEPLFNPVIVVIIGFALYRFRFPEVSTECPLASTEVIPVVNTLFPLASQIL